MGLQAKLLLSKSASECRISTDSKLVNADIPKLPGYIANAAATTVRYVPPSFIDRCISLYANVGALPRPSLIGTFTK